ncbi:aldo/keto reductase [Qingshengfaniella alkalisoli]|uniref:Aldo/keto reductase n=1 Tax=Qingshengfaniella alkalisoli TaxID=2599296 RepID=A0A5B8J4N5_9RHOB|nr:aldo/keto reductase [Qingshengfaniella alkalisoli]QDY69497.1 aldo/keto reductase [Qingshengfaniella alkalisoli]
MQYKKLGRTDIEVSDLCLGSMTWGNQNAEAEGHAQIDMALDHGINFIDTAEMYPTCPVRRETVGDTEKIIGTWLAKSGRRSDIILASKISGEGADNPRDGEPITADSIGRVVDENLKRLQTDYIDLYQLHWPNRGSYSFRQSWTYDPFKQDHDVVLDNMNEVLAALAKQVEAGKIRHVGLSNETAWGTTTWVRLAKENGWPIMQSIQNEYSLLCRFFDTDLAEVAMHEQVGLLSYSPLAAGLLTGKYRGGVVPEGSRMSLVPGLGGRATDAAHAAVEAYVAVAEKHGLDVAQMSLAFCRQRPFMTSTIFGATDLDQLKVALGSAELTLSKEVLDDIAAVHRRYPMPY